MEELLEGDDTTIDLLASSMTDAEFEELVINYLIRNSVNIERKDVFMNDFLEEKKLTGIVSIRDRYSKTIIYIKTHTERIAHILVYYQFKIMDDNNIWRKELNY